MAPRHHPTLLGNLDDENPVRRATLSHMSGLMAHFGRLYGPFWMAVASVDDSPRR